MARLPDGEVGAVWLDGRFGKATTGSALFFNKTVPGGGFGHDHQVGESTCECCRTDLFVDAEKNIHVAYRGIRFPAALAGQQVRDMVHSISYDGGKTFSKAQRISDDNWAIEGCPHTGPSLAADHNDLHAVWFTAGGEVGIYYAHSVNQGETFSTREMVSKKGRYPQMVTTNDGDLLISWTEFQNLQEHHDHSMSAGHSMPTQPAHAQIFLQIRKSGGIRKTISVTTGDLDATHSVLITVGHQVLMAWTQQEEETTAVYYSTIDIPAL